VISGGRVSFLVAGAQKCGTTALFDYLRDVPGLQLPACKEAHFFDDEDGIDWSAPDYGAYHAMFADDDRPRGEATPIYLYWPGALERIAAYNPDMKLVLLFRDPVERAWSHWKMEYARGKESEPFAWCIRQGRARMAAGSPVAGFHRVYSYVERGFYGRQLARALRLFPREQLLLLSSAALSSDPDATVSRICRFLGVAGPDRVVPRRSRVAADVAYPSVLTGGDVTYLQRQFSEETARFHELAGERLLHAAHLLPTPL
jgi:hypothetical protein